MAAFALAEYRFPGNTLLGLFLALGIMIPIRLGTVGILELMVRLNLVNTLTALILVYTARGCRSRSSSCPSSCAACPGPEGRGPDRRPVEYDLLPHRPAADAPADGDRGRVHHDPGLERSLVPADPGARARPQDHHAGAQVFPGQFVTDWNAVLAALSLAILPVLLLYLIFSKQLIRGITSAPSSRDRPHGPAQDRPDPQVLRQDRRAQGRRPRHRRRRVHRPARRLGLRQVHAAAHHRRAGDADLGPDQHRRAGGRPPAAGPARIAMVFQSYALYPHLDVAGNWAWA